MSNNLFLMVEDRELAKNYIFDKKEDEKCGSCT